MLKAENDALRDDAVTDALAISASGWARCSVTPGG